MGRKTPILGLLAILGGAALTQTPAFHAWANGGRPPQVRLTEAQRDSVTRSRLPPGCQHEGVDVDRRYLYELATCNGTLYHVFDGVATPRGRAENAYKQHSTTPSHGEADSDIVTN